MFQRVKELLDGGTRFLVTTHIDPDGDAVGCAFATAFALTGLGKDATVYMRDSVPYRYQFLPAPPNVVHEIPDGPFDAVFAVDCGNFHRVGDGYERIGQMGPIVNIDHHDTNEAFGQINILDARASSTAELLYMIIKALDVTFNYAIAVNLYTGVFTDTGSFRYDNTNARAFAICQDMTNYGVVPSMVATEIYESHPKERFLLWCQVLATLETYNGDKVALVAVTRDMFEHTGTSRECADGFVETLKEMKGLEVAALLREVGEHRYKISMRSKGSIDVASVGRVFGGGGHRKAAGCVIEGAMDEVKKKLVEALNT